MKKCTIVTLTQGLETNLEVFSEKTFDFRKSIDKEDFTTLNTSIVASLKKLKNLIMDERLLFPDCSINTCTGEGKADAIHRFYLSKKGTRVSGCYEVTRMGKAIIKCDTPIVAFRLFKDALQQSDAYALRESETTTKSFAGKYIPTESDEFLKDSRIV